MRAVAVLFAAFFAAQLPLRTTSTIHGHVVAAAAGDPIRNARVSVFTDRYVAPVPTDNSGRFTFVDVPNRPLTLTASKPATTVPGGFAQAPIRGRVVADDTGAPSDPGGRVDISAGDAVEVDLRSLADNPSAYTSAQDDGTWELGGLSGSRRLRVTGTPPGWMLDRILVNGVDVTDAPLPFGTKKQSLRDVEIVLTDRETMLEGTVRDSRDRPSIGAARVTLGEGQRVTVSLRTR